MAGYSLTGYSLTGLDRTTLAGRHPLVHRPPQGGDVGWLRASGGWAADAAVADAFGRFLAHLLVAAPPLGELHGAQRLEVVGFLVHAVGVGFFQDFVDHGGKTGFMATRYLA